MRIAFVAPELHKRGGTERCLVALAEALKARGHDITLFASKKDGAVLPGSRWYRIPIVPRPLLVRFVSFFVMSVVVRMIVCGARRQRFDVVHSTGPDVLRPTVTTLHCSASAFAVGLSQTSGAAAAYRLAARLRRVSNRIAYRVIALFERGVVRFGARRVVVISRTLADEVRMFHGVPRERLRVVPDGVDLTEFSPLTDRERADARAELGIPDVQPVVLFVGHNWERKGLEVLVEALNLLRARSNLRPCLLVVGGGGRKAYTDDVHRRLNGDVRFLGTRTDMPRMYAAADVCVLPTFQEPFGLPILEAMACGLPVLVSACAGVAELISDGTDGVLLPDRGNGTALASKLEWVLGDAELRRSIGERARETAKRYGWDAIAAELEDIYSEVRSKQ